VKTTEMRKQVVKVDGKEVEVEVPVTREHQVAEAATQTVTVPPSMRELIGLYIMCGIALFVLLLAFGASALWLYYLYRKDEPPQALSDMVKLLLANFLGILVGFMGGSTVTAEKQANIEKQFTPPASHQPV
jgi:hypothetical protein